MKRVSSIVWVCFLLVGCGGARRGTPLVAPPSSPPPAEVTAGHAVFDRFCNGCHPGGAGGLGPAINNKPLPGAAIRTQVRQGIGAMPAFSADVIPDAQLDELIAYLDWIEERDPDSQ